MSPTIDILGSFLELIGTLLVTFSLGRCLGEAYRARREAGGTSRWNSFASTVSTSMMFRFGIVLLTTGIAIRLFGR